VRGGSGGSSTTLPRLKLSEGHPRGGLRRAGRTATTGGHSHRDIARGPREFVRSGEQSLVRGKIPEEQQRAEQSPPCETKATAAVKGVTLTPRSSAGIDYQPAVDVGLTRPILPTRLWRPIWSVATAGLCAYVLLAQVAELAVTRTKMIQSAQPANTTFTLEVPAPMPRSSWLAFVCRARNDADDALTLTAEYAGSVIGSATIPPRSERRIDFAAPARAGSLVLRGRDRPWMLLYAEIANVHGFSRGLVNLFVIPAGQSFERQPAWSLLLLAGALLALAFAPPVPVSTWVRRVHLLACAAAVSLFAATAVSGLVSRYAVVLSPRTFALGCALLLSRRIAMAMRVVLTRLSGAPRVAVGITGIIAASFFASAMLQTLDRFGGNYSGFLHLSHSYAQGLPFLRDDPTLARELITYDLGYDGQFMYGMAFDPALSRYRDDPGNYAAVADAPPYRYGRVGFSALSALAALGQPQRFPVVMLWLILAGHLLLACALSAYASRHGWHPAVALAYVAIPSFMPSLLFALPEALAAAGLVGGVLFWERDRPVSAAACFACAGLIRETTLLVPAALLVAETWTRPKTTPILLATAFLPVFAWRAFMWTRLSPVYGASAFYFSPGDLGLPFTGLAQLVQSGFRHTQAAPERLAALLFPLILVSLLAAATTSLVRRRDGLSLAASGYALVAVCLNYAKIWSHVPSGERGTYELFLCLLLIALSERGIRGNALATLAGILAAYTLFASPDASVSRAALLLVR